MTMNRSLYALLAVVAGVGLIIFNPIGAFGVAVICIPIWLWYVLDGFMTRRHQRKLAMLIAEEEAEWDAAVPVEQSILAEAPEGRN